MDDGLGKRMLFGSVARTTGDAAVLFVLFFVGTAAPAAMFIGGGGGGSLGILLAFLALHGLFVVLGGLVIGPVEGMLAGVLGTFLATLFGPLFSINSLFLVVGAGFAGLLSGLIGNTPEEPKRSSDGVGSAAGLAAILVSIFFLLGINNPASYMDLFLIAIIPTAIVGGVIFGALGNYLRGVFVGILNVAGTSRGAIVDVSSMREAVQVLRGGEFVGNRLRYKVKVTNRSSSMITDLNVAVIAYPRDSLKLETEPSKRVSKLEPNGFRSPTFDFLPTQDCVQGEVIASITYVDALGGAHSLTTEAYTIRAVCDLLTPEPVTPEDFQLKLSELKCGDVSLKVDDWTPEEMQSKVLQILQDANFYEVGADSEIVGDKVVTTTKGWAKGKYTGKSLGIVVTMAGKSGIRGATAKIEMSGEDEAMIMPAIDEISQKVSAWLCPMCGASLPMESVNELKAGKSVACPFCSVTIDR